VGISLSPLSRFHLGLATHADEFSFVRSIEQSPSGTTILVLDIIIFLIQIITVYVAYLCDPLPVATTSPTVLLPPVDISDDPLLPRANEINEGNGELQNWSVIRRRKRKGKGKVGGGFGNYLEAGEEGVVNLNEEEDEEERTTCECDGVRWVRLETINV
jgi:hypothetical protein